jgi:TetR/AcrR family transcriptional regulator, ethionamide resistance regulator
MGDRGGTRRPRRIWRQPDDARREILGAAEKLLSGRSFRELTVDDLMAATGMTRSSFYHYFTGLDELAIALMRRVQGEMMPAVAPWLRDDYEGDPTEGTAHGVLESARVFARHGPVHRAWRHGVVEEWIRANAAQLRTQRDRGLTRVADPEETARALLLMNTAVPVERLGKQPPDPLEAVAQTLAEVWTRALYPDATCR